MEAPVKKNVVRDSNTRIRIVVVLALAAISAFVLFGRSKSPEPTPSANEVSTATPMTDISEQVQAATETPVDESMVVPEAKVDSKAPLYAPVSAQERASLDTLSTILFEETRGTSTPKDLVTRLVRLGFEPMVARDSNEYTGSMVIVRTKNALPGTRYFHAQFFTDENGAFYPQHVSFEFRPTQSFDDVVRSLEARFGRLGRPTTNDGIWMTWKLPNDYSLWIKKMEKQDLTGDPFNAYSTEDLNTLRVAIEKDVAGHEDDEPHL